MASTIIDSAIFQGIFSSDAMRKVWSDENRTQKYLDIEAALARVQGRLGLIPQEAADEIVSHCQLEQIDMAKLRQQTERIGYPILGVVSQLNLLCRDKLGEFCHWGATTQDITDTATVLQIREALEIVDAEWRSEVRRRELCVRLGPPPQRVRAAALPQCIGSGHPRLLARGQMLARTWLDQWRLTPNRSASKLDRRGSKSPPFRAARDSRRWRGLRRNELVCTAHWLVSSESRRSSLLPDRFGVSLQ